MKGNPLLRLGVILILLVVVFWLVLKITHRTVLTPESSVTGSKTSQVIQTNATSITSSLRVILLLHTAPSPLHCSISQHGVVLITESNAIAPGEYRADAEIAKGEDLLVTADWKNEEPHALRAEVLVQGYQAPLEKTFWAQQSLEDTLPIPDSFLP